MTRTAVEARHKRFIKRQRASEVHSRVGAACPECGEREGIQDNGAKGDERTFRCETCHCQWDASFGLEV